VLENLETFEDDHGRCLALDGRDPYLISFMAFLTMMQRPPEPV
jgi:hypothetical protein